MNSLKTLNTLGNDKLNFLMIENYIYLYHIDKYIILPSFADSVTDTQSVTFTPTTPLSRSAPIFSYTSSGPRSIQVNFNLHRDLMYEINKDIVELPKKAPNNPVQDDYVDLFIKYIQAAVLPSYEAASRMVNPPVVALRMGNDIFIKGVISGSLGITYGYPILSNGRYANVSIGFGIQELDPYDAKDVILTGSYRNVSTSLERSNTDIAGDSGYNALGTSGRATTTQNTINSNASLREAKRSGGGGTSYGGGAGRR